MQINTKTKWYFLLSPVRHRLRVSPPNALRQRHTFASRVRSGFEVTASGTDEISVSAIENENHKKRDKVSKSGDNVTKGRNTIYRATSFCVNSLLSDMCYTGLLSWVMASGNRLSDISIRDFKRAPRVDALAKSG